MQFKLFALAFTALSGVVHAQGGNDTATDDSQLQSNLTPESVQASITAVTDLSADTLEIATSLNPANLFTAVPRLINNFRNIVTTVITDVEAISNAELEDPFSEEGQQEVCEAFRDFVRVHIQLLEALIGRAGILASTPFTAPIGAILRVLEQGVDAFAFGVIDLVPTCAEGAQEDKQELDQTFEVVIERFS